MLMSLHHLFRLKLSITLHTGVRESVESMFGHVRVGVGF